MKLCREAYHGRESSASTGKFAALLLPFADALKLTSLFVLGTSMSI